MEFSNPIIEVIENRRIEDRILPFKVELIQHTKPRTKEMRFTVETTHPNNSAIDVDYCTTFDGAVLCWNLHVQHENNRISVEDF